MAEATQAPVTPQTVRDLIGAALLDALERETPGNQFTHGELADIVADWALPAHERMIREQVRGETWDPFADVAAITAWLDTSNPAGPHEDSMRVLKLVEESGEAAAAYIGMVGQNPRKGVTHTQTDLLNELADVALTALCAMQHFTQSTAATRGVLASKVAGIMARSDIRTLAETGA